MRGGHALSVHGIALAATCTQAVGPSAASCRCIRDARARLGYWVSFLRTRAVGSYEELWTLNMRSKATWLGLVLYPFGRSMHGQERVLWVLPHTSDYMEPKTSA